MSALPFGDSAMFFGKRGLFPLDLRITDVWEDVFFGFGHVAIADHFAVPVCSEFYGCGRYSE